MKPSLSFAEIILLTDITIFTMVPSLQNALTISGKHISSVRWYLYLALFLIGVVLIFVAFSVQVGK